MFTDSFQRSCSAGLLVIVGYVVVPLALAATASTASAQNTTASRQQVLGELFKTNRVYRKLKTEQKQLKAKIAAQAVARPDLARNLLEIGSKIGKMERMALAAPAKKPSAAPAAKVPAKRSPQRAKVAAVSNRKPASAASTAGFDQVIKPFFKSHCVKCHGPKKKKGKLALHTIQNDLDTADGSERWTEILNQLTFDEMPPPTEKKRPKPLESAKVVDWIKKRLAETGKAEGYIKKLLAPEYGNWTSHEKLFSGEIKTPPFSPSRLWRMSPKIFSNKGFGGRSPFTYVTREKGIRDYGQLSGVDRSTVQMLMINADKWLDHRESKGEFKKFTDNQAAPSAQVIEETARREFSRIVQRSVTKEKTAKYAAFLTQNIKIGGKLAGLRTTIKVMFLSPEAIYRMEFGLGKKDQHGRRRLSSPEIGHAIAYALTDTGPQRTRPISQAMGQGKFGTREDVAAVVQKVLDEGMPHEFWNSTRLPRIMRFFNEFFGMIRAQKVFKDDARRQQAGIGWWFAEGLYFDAKLILIHHLKRDKDFIAEILTTDKYFVAHPGDTALAQKFFADKGSKVIDGIRQFPDYGFSQEARAVGDLSYITPYNLPATKKKEKQLWNWPVEQPFALPRRAGLLTHPAWLAAHSLNDGNDPIHRGIWVRERLLAGVIQDIPPDVDAQVPPNPHKTLKERLDVIREEKCWRCHSKFNPLGETFEMFDDFGRHRKTFYFDKKTKKLVTRRDKQFQQMLAQNKLTARPVDSAGEITGTGDPKVDGKVKDAVEMMQRIGRSERARQSFIRHLFRYFMGRNEMLSDSRTLIEADQAYVKSGGSFKALVVSLLSSDSFLYRR
jgi:hypothetical protein